MRDLDTILIVILYLGVVFAMLFGIVSVTSNDDNDVEFVCYSDVIVTDKYVAGKYANFYFIETNNGSFSCRLNNKTLYNSIIIGNVYDCYILDGELDHVYEVN